jgi:hypothetical protein
MGVASQNPCKIVQTTPTTFNTKENLDFVCINPNVRGRLFSFSVQNLQNPLSHKYLIFLGRHNTQVGH